MKTNSIFNQNVGIFRRESFPSAHAAASFYIAIYLLVTINDAAFLSDITLIHFINLILMFIFRNKQMIRLVASYESDLPSIADVVAISDCAYNEANNSICLHPSGLCDCLDKSS